MGYHCFPVWKRSYDGRFLVNMFISVKDIQRFKDKINKTDTCWIWTAWKHRQGYGKFSIKNKTWIAHRIAWIISRKRKIPKGLCICHHCDNPSCVRPSHLFLGTHKQNTHDMIRKGRQSIGSSHGNSKLTEYQVCEIRKLYFNNGFTQKQLADLFNIHFRTIHKILHRMIWNHLPMVRNEIIGKDFIKRGRNHYKSKMAVFG